MACCADSYETQFDARRATVRLRQFRRKGAPKETRLLIDLLREQGVAGATLLDIGAGVGAVQAGLFADDGANAAVSVDASSGWEQAARSLAEERGYRDRVEYRRGDFVEIADSVARADVVTLDKVICCFDDMPGLVARSAEKAGRLYGAVYPRDNPVSRTFARISNAMRRIRRNDFRVYVHPESAIRAVLEEHGMRLRSSAQTAAWRVVVFARA